VLTNIRDISIIVLALESILIGIILTLLLWQVRALVRLLKSEVKPILEETQETARTVQVTTKFVGQSVARPAVNTISFMTGVRRAVKSVKEQVGSASFRASSAKNAVASSEEVTHE